MRRASPDYLKLSLNQRIFPDTLLASADVPPLVPAGEVTLRIRAVVNIASGRYFVVATVGGVEPGSEYSTDNNTSKARESDRLQVIPGTAR